MSTTHNKLFAMFLNGTDEESAIAYKMLCDDNVKLDDVSHTDDDGGRCANHGDQKFVVLDKKG